MLLAPEIEASIQRQLAEIRNELRCLDGTEREQAVLDEALSLEDAAERLFERIACEPARFDACVRCN
jgi:hypothetical protein